jgi:GNAT superfamily N-acetyltransferase
MNVSLHPAELEDAPTLLPLMKEFYAHEGLHFVERAACKTLEALLDDPALGSAWFIRVEDILAGYAVLTLQYSLEFHGRAACLDEIYLRPEFRGRGVGTIALGHLEAICRALGVRSLHLVVERANSQAARFYQKAGFEMPPRDLMWKPLRSDGAE